MTGAFLEGLVREDIRMFFEGVGIKGPGGAGSRFLISEGVWCLYPLVDRRA